MEKLYDKTSKKVEVYKLISTYTRNVIHFTSKLALYVLCMQFSVQYFYWKNYIQHAYTKTVMEIFGLVIFECEK